MEFKQNLLIVRRWAWWIVLGLTLGLLAGYVISVYQTPVYQSATRILVMRASQGMPYSADLSYLNDQQLTQVYIQLLTTQPVLDSASARLGFPIDIKKTSVQQIGTAQVIKLSVEDSDPARAALIANQMVSALMEQNDQLQLSQYAETEKTLEAQIAQVQGQISALELQASRVSVQTVQEQLAEVETQIAPLQAEVTGLRKQIASLSPTTSLTNRTKIAEAQARLDEIEPLLSLYQQIHSDLIVLGKPSDAASSEGARLDQLESILGLYKQLYINLLSSMESLRLTRLQNTPNVIQIEAAAIPEKPVRPLPLESTLLGGVFGLLLAGGIIFLVDRLDNSLKTMQDIERVLKLPVLGYIAEVKHKAGAYVTHHPYSPVSEAFHSLCTNLEFASANRPLRRLLVTSVGPHEGKTTVAANLAAILAQGGKRVILMDVNLRQPGVHRFFGMTNQAGLSDIFRGSETVKTLVRQADDLKNISILTSGSLPPNPIELLDSACMDQILQEAEGAADILILDGPPSIVADMQILAARVDGVLMVVQPGHTEADAALAAQEQLKRAGAHLLGVVLNRIPRRHAEYFGGYRHYSPAYSDHRYYASALESQTQTSTGLALLFHRHNGRKEARVPIPK